MSAVTPKFYLPFGSKVVQLGLGNIILPNGEIFAGNRDENTRFKPYEDLIDFVTTQDKSNTTISVVGINVDLGAKEYYEIVAHFGSHGQVRAINPVHTAADGDTVFVFSTAELKNPLNKICRVHFLRRLHYLQKQHVIISEYKASIYLVN